MKLQKNMTNNVFRSKSKNKKIKHKKPCRSRELNPETLAPKSDALFNSAPPSQMKVTIGVKQFNCFYAMGRNVNEQSRICGLYISNKFIVSVIDLF